VPLIKYAAVASQGQRFWLHWPQPGTTVTASVYVDVGVLMVD